MRQASFQSANLDNRHSSGLRRISYTNRIEPITSIDKGVVEVEQVARERRATLAIDRTGNVHNPAQPSAFTPTMLFKRKKLDSYIALSCLSFLLISQAGCPGFGCRRVLCCDGPSNLWPRYVQRQSDQALCQEGFCPNPTHLTKATSDYELGFTAGYYETAMSRIQPYPQYGYIPAHYPTQSYRRINNNGGNPEFFNGISSGVAVASSATLGGFAPHQGPLESVPLTLPPKQPSKKPSSTK